MREINGDDLEDIIVEEVRANDKNELAERVKKYLKGNLKKEVKGLFKDFAEDLAKI